MLTLERGFYKMCRHWTVLLAITAAFMITSCSKSGGSSADGRSTVNSGVSEEDLEFKRSSEQLIRDFEKLAEQGSNSHQRDAEPAYDQQCSPENLDQVTLVAKKVYDMNRDLVDTLLELRSKANSREIDQVKRLANRIKPMSIDLAKSAGELLVKSCLPEGSFQRNIAQAFVDNLPHLMSQGVDLAINLALYAPIWQIQLFMQVVDMAVNALVNHRDILGLGIH